LHKDETYLIDLIVRFVFCFSPQKGILKIMFNSKLKNLYIFHLQLARRSSCSSLGLDVPLLHNFHAGHPGHVTDRVGKAAHPQADHKAL